MPNDDVGAALSGQRGFALTLPYKSELDRLDLTHGMLRLTMNGELFHAPLGPKPGRILDLGTGTGIWAIDVGDQYPSAEIIGTDLSATQPSWSAVPHPFPAHLLKRCRKLKDWHLTGSPRT